MSTFLRNKTISKTTPLREENPFPRFNVVSHKRPGIRLSLKYITTLLSGEGGEGRTGTATIFRKMLSKYTIFSTVLSKIAEWPGYGNFRKVTQDPHFLKKCKGRTKENFSKIAQKNPSFERPKSTLAQMALSFNYYALKVQRLEKI